LRLDDGPILFTKLSPDSLRIIQTQLGGGHLFDGFLPAQKSSVCTDVLYSCTLAIVYTNEMKIVHAAYTRVYKEASHRDWDVACARARNDSSMLGKLYTDTT
jgi:hypothetical protein